MLSLEDCLGLCALREDEVAAIAEHEHIPFMAALELGHYLCHTEGGARRIKRMILDDIAAARDAGDFVHVARLRRALAHFLVAHPECDAAARDRAAAALMVWGARQALA
jgi:hypothetical protein